MRVGAYIDGLNLYYGGRHLCGRSTPRWRWLDLAKLVERLVSRNPAWIAKQASVDRIAYCTALISGHEDALGRQRQQTYLAALGDDPRIKVEMGNFITRKIRAVDAASGAMRVVEVPEEKGSDVNLASHLLVDLHTGKIDAAVLITNDSDLRFPCQHTRMHVPLGTVNPRGRPTAQALRGQPGDGAGGHWWYSLTADDFLACQLPEIVGNHQKPTGW